jgi:hypothetical protein
MFVAVADTGTGNRVMTSPNGTTWMSRTSAADNAWNSVCWAPELSLFVAVAFTGTGNRVMTSPDGITWTSRTSAADNGWLSVCWAPELSVFVAVADTGAGNRVMTSAIGMPNSKSVVKALPSQMTVLANGNVGIGITNPLANTHIVHTGTGDIFRADDDIGGTTPFIINESGYVGIGTAISQGHLTINTENSSVYGIVIDRTSTLSSLRQNGIYIKTGTPNGSGTVDGIIRFDNSDGTKVILDNRGFLSLSTSIPLYNLQIDGVASINYLKNIYNKLLVLWDGTSADSVATATNFYGFGINDSTLRFQVDATTSFHRFYGAATQFGYVNNATGFVNTFTGQHRSFPEPSIASSTANPAHFIGLIACASGRHVSVNEKIPVSGKAAITISEAVPTVRLSAVECDPSVFGVISDVEDPSDRKDHYGSFVATHEAIPGDTRLFINSLGEGALWVSDAGGPVTNGDFITTSVVPGYGSKQSDSVLRNYTVAKITMDCDFSGATVPQRRIKKKTITLAVEEIVKAERSIEEVKDIVEYDIVAQRYVRKKVTETRTVTDTLYDEFDLYDETGAVVGKHKVERRATVTKTMEENDLDAYGNIQWEDATDAEGTPITEVPYELRYLTQNGDELSQADYNVRKEAGESVYRAAFLACTYHCG